MADTAGRRWSCCPPTLAGSSLPGPPSEPGSAPHRALPTGGLRFGSRAGRLLVLQTRCLAALGAGRPGGRRQQGGLQPPGVRGCVGSVSGVSRPPRPSVCVQGPPFYRAAVSIGRAHPGRSHFDATPSVKAEPPDKVGSSGAAGSDFSGRGAGPPTGPCGAVFPLPRDASALQGVVPAVRVSCAPRARGRAEVWHGLRKLDVRDWELPRVAEGQEAGTERGRRGESWLLLREGHAMSTSSLGGRGRASGAGKKARLRTRGGGKGAAERGRRRLVVEVSPRHTRTVFRNQSPALENQPAKSVP